MGVCLCVVMDKLEQLNLTRRLLLQSFHNVELLYCVYSKLKMGHHDSFAHRALHPSSWIVVFVEDVGSNQCDRTLYRGTEDWVTTA